MPPGLACAALAAILHAGAVAAAAGDPARGEAVFQKCYACHSVVPGETGLSGPNLAGVVGRRVASEPGFAYSPALVALAEADARVWSEAALEAFLRAPEEVAPGTAMAFVGLRDPGERADVIAFLKETR
ncbi:MAG TPA: c-type cytochrome [Geminicoccaceae bacterium]|nr:c-type cytochrome [Geminicoccaceae bacterium]